MHGKCQHHVTLSYTVLEEPASALPYRPIRQCRETAFDLSSHGFGEHLPDLSFLPQGHSLFTANATLVSGARLRFFCRTCEVDKPIAVPIAVPLAVHRDPTALGGRGFIPVVMPTRLPGVAQIGDAMSMLGIDGQLPVGYAGPVVDTVHPAIGVPDDVVTSVRQTPSAGGAGNGGSASPSHSRSSHCRSLSHSRSRSRSPHPEDTRAAAMNAAIAQAAACVPEGNK